MRVVIAGKVYDSKDELIVLEIDDTELRLINEMQPVSDMIQFGTAGERHQEYFLQLAKDGLAGKETKS